MRTDIARANIETAPSEKGADGSSATPQQRFAAAREALRREINDHGIVRVPPGSRELWALKCDPRDYYDGNFSIWQFYLRACMLDAEHLNFIARCFWSVYRQRYMAQPFQISGVEQASIPIITAILMTAPAFGINLHAFTVRKEVKHFGLRNIIEGAPNFDLPVVFVDDLTSPTHSTLWHWVRVMRDNRINIYPRAFVVVHKCKRHEAREIATTVGNINIESIFTLDDFNMTYEEYQANKVRLGQ